ncbi:MAG TPA: hypothetical protein VHD59_10150 [Pseudolabrys sp.]|jgi:hypothetical protein|nr:hypothetical protein [Pseudolabrys sp.]
MQPLYIKTIWVCALTIFFGLVALTPFVSKQFRDYMHLTQVASLVFAYGVTVVSNKIRTGLFFPGIKKKS